MKRLLLLSFLTIAWVIPCHAMPEFKLVIKNHLFHPSQVTIPANQKVRFLIINQGDSPEEFESYSLNREKVIMGHSRTIIYIGPLAPGNYHFFGDFHPRSAQGQVIAE